MAESWSLPNISFMAPQEAPRSALLQGAEADQGPGSTARRAADAPAIAIPSRGRERQLAPRRHAEPSHVSPRGSSTVHAMDPWILEPQTAGETRIFLESWPLSFLRAGPPKSRKKAGESRTHPNLETNFAKLTPGPTRREGWTADAERTSPPARAAVRHAVSPSRSVFNTDHLRTDLVATGCASM